MMEQEYASPQVSLRSDVRSIGLLGSETAGGLITTH